MKELYSKFLSMFRYIPYIIDENQRYNAFSVVFLSCLRRGLSMTISRRWKKQCEKQNSVMTRIKINKKVYQIGGLKDKITLIQEIRIINFTKIPGIITKGIKAVTIKVLNPKIPQQKRENPHYF